MVFLAAVDYLHYLFMIPLALLSLFLILVILVQRGRGGGLTGALGGMGGQSAFGTKAGDLFTRITIVVAAIWVLLSMASIKVLAQRQALNPNLRGQPTVTSPADGKGATPSATPATPAGKAPSAATPTTPPPTSPPPAAPPTTPSPATTPPAGKTP